MKQYIRFDLDVDKYISNVLFVLVDVSGIQIMIISLRLHTTVRISLPLELCLPCITNEKRTSL
jgi:hypothetical protein